MVENSDSPDKGDLLEELRRVGDIVEGAPSVAEVNKHSEWSHDPFYREFGSWEAALRKAGFEPDSNQRHPELRVSKEELLEELREVVEMIGRPPSSREMKRFTEHGISTYQRKFGSWNEAIREAGFHTPFKPPSEREKGGNS